MSVEGWTDEAENLWQTRGNMEAGSDKNLTSLNLINLINEDTDISR